MMSQEIVLDRVLCWIQVEDEESNFLAVQFILHGRGYRSLQWSPSSHARIKEQQQLRGKSPPYGRLYKLYYSDKIFGVPLEKSCS